MLGQEGAATFDAQGAFKAASTAIPKYLSKGIDIIYVQTNDMGNGVVQATEQNGLKPGKNVFLMTGTSSGSTANLRSGKITTAVLQSPVIEGTLIVDNVARRPASSRAAGSRPCSPDRHNASDRPLLTLSCSALWPTPRHWIRQTFSP